MCANDGALVFCKISGILVPRINGRDCIVSFCIFTLEPCRTVVLSRRSKTADFGERVQRSVAMSPKGNVLVREDGRRLVPADVRRRKFLEGDAEGGGTQSGRRVSFSADGTAPTPDWLWRSSYPKARWGCYRPDVRRRQWNGDLGRSAPG